MGNEGVGPPPCFTQHLCSDVLNVQFSCCVSAACCIFDSCAVQLCLHLYKVRVSLSVTGISGSARRISVAMDTLRYVYKPTDGSPYRWIRYGIYTNQPRDPHVFVFFWEAWSLSLLRYRSVEAKNKGT